MFGKATLSDFEETEDKVLPEVFDELPSKTFSSADFAGSETVTDLLAKLNDMSKGEVRRLTKNAGFSINQEKISVAESNEKFSGKLLKDKYLLIKKGKQFYLLTVGG